MMMLCTRCRKRPATVFVSQSADSKDMKGYCFVCAKELGIQPVNDLMDNMMDTLKRTTGMTEEEFQEATEQMTQLMRMDAQEEEEGEADFSPGGAATLPAEKGNTCLPCSPCNIRSSFRQQYSLCPAPARRAADPLLRKPCCVHYTTQALAFH